jgi:hypothetical protein
MRTSDIHELLESIFKCRKDRVHSLEVFPNLCSPLKFRDAPRLAAVGGAFEASGRLVSALLRKHSAAGLFMKCERSCSGYP